MSNRRRAGSQKREPGVDFALVQMFRRECSSCGSSVLRWFTGSEAAEVLGVGVAARILDTMPRSRARNAACWTCLRCGEAGAFGPVEWG